jgi:hypothetical protein
VGVVLGLGRVGAGYDVRGVRRSEFLGCEGEAAAVGGGLKGRCEVRCGGSSCGLRLAWFRLVGCCCWGYILVGNGGSSSGGGIGWSLLGGLLLLFLLAGLL